MSWCASAVCLMLLVKVALSQTDVRVTTSKGIVVGLRVDPNPATNASFDAFIGVPYGQIPARFQRPVPRSNWSIPLVAQSDGPACPQPDAPFSEDCLFLNIFTPVNASLNPRKYPVMAYIHGSGFTAGSSSSLQYGPDFLVPHGVILVTMNYRLGAAGFLTLGTSEASGNLGIFDTLLALQWIQEEIPAFGGDPAQVTLFGHSAGSVIVLFTYLNPSSSGLFTHAIVQSGAAFLDGVVQSAEEAVGRAKSLAADVGCDSTTNSSLLLSCLQHADINAIVNKQNISLPVEEIASGKNLRFRPVADTSFAKLPFFTDTLDNMMRQATIRAKPLVMGFATADGIVKFQEDGWKYTEANLAGFIPQSLQTSLTDSRKSAIVNKIRDRYFPDRVEDNKILDLVNIFTEGLFAYTNIKVMRHLSNFTYGYVFNYKGIWAPMPPYFSQYHVTGVFHGAELPYLFYSANSSQDVRPCSLNLPELRFRDTIVTWWTTFAKTGVPDPSGTWNPVSNGNYLFIGSPAYTVNSSEVEDLYYNFWANLNSTNNTAIGLVNHPFVVIIAVWSLNSIFK